MARIRARWTFPGPSPTSAAPAWSTGAAGCVASATCVACSAMEASAYAGDRAAANRAWHTRGVFADDLRRWVASVPAPAQPFTYGAVEEAGRTYPLVGLRLPGPHPVLVTAGFHGDEKAGPRTLLDHAAELVAYAVERGVGLTLFPCVNPSGFEDHTRYN